MPWNLPVQFETGSQTSNRISESEDGFSDPATRQNAGRFARGLAPGGVNSPAGRDSATAIVAFGNPRVASLSQVTAPVCVNAHGPSATMAKIRKTGFMNDLQFRMVAQSMVGLQTDKFL